jgi:hypothetical protein
MQDKAAYDELCQKGVLRCKPELSEMITDPVTKPAYDWLVKQMKTRIGTPSEGVEYPIWAWYIHYGENKKLDLRKCDFRGYVGEYYIIEAEIDDCDILLSDEEMWHLVLNNGYFAINAGLTEDTIEFDEDDAWFDSLPPEEQLPFKIKSWEKVFDKSCCPWEFVQATFWELRKEQDISVRYFKGRGKSQN